MLLARNLVQQTSAALVSILQQPQRELCVNLGLGNVGNIRVGGVMRIFPSLCTIASVVLALFASGCATIAPQPISASRIAEVVDDAKRQVSIYMSYQNDNNRDRALRHRKRRFACGSGLIDFDITQVKLDLLTTLDNTAGAGISASSIPISIGTFGFSLTESVEGSNSQELVFVANPKPDGTFRYSVSENEPPAPLVAVMASLREGLIKEADVTNRVCFQSAAKEAGGGAGQDNAKSQGANSFKIAVSIINDVSGKLSLGVAPLALSGSGETKATTGNTVTFTFAPHSYPVKAIDKKATPDTAKPTPAVPKPAPTSDQEK